MVHESASLKSKRHVIKSVLGKVRSKFDISIAEVGDHDKWQSAMLGFAVVSTESGHAHTMVEKIIDYIENLHIAEVTGSAMEIIHFK
jgi:uncharacterized protein YlxP (DUF503 family)